MPFMKGAAPIRRTLQYLESSNLVLRDRIQIFSVNYNTTGENHEGARQFVFWNLPQLQYKNPAIQVATFKNMTPSPFIQCFLDDGDQILLDIDWKTKEEIIQRVKRITCKTDEILHLEKQTASMTDNPANFGAKCGRHCMCEIPGQVPCPAVVPLPRSWRGKFKFQKPDEL
nr:EOG090X0FQ5 [Leptodora kindtii]